MPIMYPRTLDLGCEKNWLYQGLPHGLPSWLVVWNMNFIFLYNGNFIIPTDEFIFFKMVKTTNQYRYNILYIYILPSLAEISPLFEGLFLALPPFFWAQKCRGFGFGRRGWPRLRTESGWCGGCDTGIAISGWREWVIGDLIGGYIYIDNYI